MTEVSDKRPRKGGFDAQPLQLVRQARHSTEARTDHHVVHWFVCARQQAAEELYRTRRCVIMLRDIARASDQMRNPAAVTSRNNAAVSGLHALGSFWLIYLNSAEARGCR